MNDSKTTLLQGGFFNDWRHAHDLDEDFSHIARIIALCPQQFTPQRSCGDSRKNPSHPRLSRQKKQLRVETQSIASLPRNTLRGATQRSNLFLL